MAQTVDGIFSAMPERFLPEKAAGVTASMSYHITGEGGGDYSCVIADGQVTLLRELKADAQAALTMTAQDWIDLNEGKLDPTAAYMSGKLKATGDLNLLQKFPRYFKRVAAAAGSGIPLAELVPMRLGALASAFKVVVGAEAWGEGPELKGDEAAVRGLVEGLVEPGPALLGGQLAFAGDMALLRQAWGTWSANPVKPRKPKRPGALALLGMWIKAKLGM